MTIASGEDKWNTAFGVPPLVGFLWIQICLTGAVGIICVILTNRALQLARVPTSLLWIFYYVIGLVFHFSNLLVLDASSYGFLAPGAIHVYIEGLLCVQALTMNEDSIMTNAWGRYWTFYFCIMTFATWCLWQPLSFFVFGSLVILPADTLTLPSSLAILQQAKAQRCTADWYLGVAWFFNTPIVALIFTQVVWGAKGNNNWAALSFVLLQIQYLFLGAAVIKVFGRNSNDVYESVPNAVTATTKSNESAVESTVWTMKRGLVWTVGLLGVQVVFAVLVPLGLGMIDMDMILKPWGAYLPGIH